MGIWQTIRFQGASNGLQSIVASMASWARFMYLILNHMCVDFVKMFLTSPDISLQSLWMSFAKSIYNAQTDFEAIVLARAETACTGIQILFGGGTPWGLFMYYSCMSTQDLLRAFFNLFGLMFVEVPMIKCACTDAGLSNPVSYMISKCIPEAPIRMQPVLIQVHTGFGILFIYYILVLICIAFSKVQVLFSFPICSCVLFDPFSNVVFVFNAN